MTSPRRWPWVAAALLVALLLGGWYALYRTSWFAVREIQVQGAPTELVEPIRQASGITVGSPLITVDIDGAQRAVAAVAAVKQAEVHRVWPTTITINVTMRVAVAATQANGQWWLLDDSGLPYQPAADQPAGLTVVRLATPGQSDPATVAAVAVVAALDRLPPETRALVAEVSAPTAFTVTLNLTDGRSVVWGDASRSAQKASVLAAVLQQPGTVYDLSDPSMVTVK